MDIDFSRAWTVLKSLTRMPHPLWFWFSSGVVIAGVAYWFGR
jgi:hypothetical protein